MTENFSNYHNVAKPNPKALNALKGVRPIKPVGIGSWKNHLPRVAGQIQLHDDITNELIQFGYEQNDNWLELVKDIQPDLSKSFWPEYFTKKDLKKRKFGEKREVLNILLRKIGANPTRIKVIVKKLIGR